MCLKAHLIKDEDDDGTTPGGTILTGQQRRRSNCELVMPKTTLTIATIAGRISAVSSQHYASLQIENRIKHSGVNCMYVCIYMYIYIYIVLCPWMRWYAYLLNWR